VAPSATVVVAVEVSGGISGGRASGRSSRLTEKGQGLGLCMQLRLRVLGRLPPRRR
jgi:hypothetical protein